MQDLLVFQADMAKRERKETRVILDSRENRDKRATLDCLDFLVNLVFQVLMDRRERGDYKVSLASQVQRALLGTLDSKENWETEDFLDKKVMMALLVHPAPTPLSKEILGFRAIMAYQDPEDHLVSQDRKDNKVSQVFLDLRVKMDFLDTMASLEAKESLASQGHRDPEDSQAPQDLMVFQDKWVHLAHPPWITGSL